MALKNITPLKSAFVMMPFAKNFQLVRDAIRKAADTCGFFCIWADEVSDVGKITDQIEREIRKAHICICDLTNQNANVAWEYGYATALGKKVVLLSQNIKDLFFDIRDNRTLIYNERDLALTLIQPLILVLNRLEVLSIPVPEIMAGTKKFEMVRLGAVAKNITDTPYEIFNLIDLANEHIFLAGQNLYFIQSNPINERKFKTQIKNFFKRSKEAKIEIMLCDENCLHAIETWQYVQGITNYREQLIQVLGFLGELKKEIELKPNMKGRFLIKKFDFIPLSATFIDPNSENGLAIITPNLFQRMNDSRPCYIFSKTYNRDIFKEYWSIYNFWFSAKENNPIV